MQDHFFLALVKKGFSLMVVLVCVCLCEKETEREDSYTHSNLSHTEHRVMFRFTVIGFEQNTVFIFGFKNSGHM